MAQAQAEAARIKRGGRCRHPGHYRGDSIGHHAEIYDQRTRRTDPLAYLVIIWEKQLDAVTGHSSAVRTLS
ncbi:MAG TPA: hypothetical protein VFA32_21150 [Dehalococcoidia bacterium]|jgi:hypothetical protein|nr:hypothetical protein [Dehalococcoidia bacterium]